jgi:translation elongation factor EF-4
MINNKQYSDLIIVINGHELMAHKAVLATRSQVFTAMFESDMKKNVKIGLRLKKSKKKCSKSFSHSYTPQKSINQWLKNCSLALNSMVLWNLKLFANKF